MYNPKSDSNNRRHVAFQRLDLPPHGRISTLFGRKVRILWWHDVVAGLFVAGLAIAVLTVAMVAL